MAEAAVTLYTKEQGFEEAITRAVNRVISERAPNGVQRLAELLGATTNQKQDQTALQAELTAARAKLVAQDEQLAAATERFEVLKQELTVAVARLPPPQSCLLNGTGIPFSLQGSPV